MQQIPTTDVTVSKLRKAAKLKVRDESIKLAAALDLVAKAAGYDHWKHVLICAKAVEQTEETLLKQTGVCLYYSTQNASPNITCVSGTTGSGKSIYLTDQILNALRQSRSVIAIECGTDQLVKAFGNVAANLSILTVDHFTENRAAQQNAIFKLLTKATKNTVIVVDDIECLTDYFDEGLMQKITDSLSIGASLYFSFMTADWNKEAIFFNSPLSNLLKTHKFRRVHLF